MIGRRSRWTAALAVGLQLAVVVSPSRAADVRGCVEAFSNTGEVAKKTVDAINGNFPSLGIVRTATGFDVLSGSVSKPASSVKDLAFILLEIVRSGPDDRPLEMYFQGINERAAWNIISDVRLAAANPRQSLEGYVAAAGNGGGGLRGNDGLTSAAGAEAPKPNGDPSKSPGHSGNGQPPGSGGSDAVNGGSEPEPWRRAAAFRELDKRYDWRLAEVRVENISFSEGSAVPNGVDPRPYTYKVVIPASRQSRGTQLSVFVYFKKDKPKPAVEAVGSSIESALHDDRLRRATIQKAAKSVRQRVSSDYPESQTLIKAFDLTIVKLVVRRSNG